MCVYIVNLNIYNYMFIVKLGNNKQHLEWRKHKFAHPSTYFLRRNGHLHRVNELYPSATIIYTVAACIYTGEMVIYTV